MMVTQIQVDTPISGKMSFIPGYFSDTKLQGTNYLIGKLIHPFILGSRGDQSTGIAETELLKRKEIVILNTNKYRRDVDDFLQMRIQH